MPMLSYYNTSDNTYDNNNDYINQTMYDNYIKRYHVVEVKLNNLIASTAKAKKTYATKSKRK